MARIAFQEPDWQQIPTIVDEVIWSYQNPRQCREYREFVETLELWGVTGHRRWLDDRGMFTSERMSSPVSRVLKKNQELFMESVERLYQEEPVIEGGFVLLCGSLSTVSGEERFRLHRLVMSSYLEDSGVFISKEAEQRKTIFSGKPSQASVAFIHLGRNVEDEPQPSLFRLSLHTLVFGMDSFQEPGRTLAQSLDRVDGTPDMMATLVSIDGNWTGLFLMTTNPLDLVRRWKRSEVLHQNWGYYANCQRGEAILAVAKDRDWNLRLLEKEWKVRPTTRQLVLHRFFRRQSLRRPLVTDVPASSKAQRETRARTAYLSPASLLSRGERIVFRALMYQSEFPERLERKTSVKLRSEAVAPLPDEGIDAPEANVVSHWYEDERPEPLPPRFLQDLSAKLREDLRANPWVTARESGPGESGLRLRLGRSYGKEALQKHWCMVFTGYDYSPPVIPAGPLPVSLLELERQLQTAMLTSTPELDRENLVLNWYFPVQPNPLETAKMGVFQLRVPLALFWQGIALGDLFEGRPIMHAFLRDDGLYITGLDPKGVAHHVNFNVPLELPPKFRLSLKRHRWSKGSSLDRAAQELGSIVFDVCTFLMVSGNGRLKGVEDLEYRSD